MIHFIGTDAQNDDEIEDDVGDRHNEVVIWRKYADPFNSLPVIINTSFNFFIYVYSLKLLHK
jgi:hypothetical protein